MGHKKVLFPVDLFDASTGIMTGTNTITSEYIPVQNHDNLGIQLSWTGDAIGNIYVLGTNDISTAPFSLTFNPVLAQPAGVDGGYGISINQFPWLYVALQYTNISGNGILVANIVAKDLN